MPSCFMYSISGLGVRVVLSLGKRLFPVSTTKDRKLHSGPIATSYLMCLYITGLIIKNWSIDLLYLSQDGNTLTHQSNVSVCSNSLWVPQQWVSTRKPAHYMVQMEWIMYNYEANNCFYMYITHVQPECCSKTFYPYLLMLVHMYIY